MSVAPASTARVAARAASGSSSLDQTGAELLPVAALVMRSGGNPVWRGRRIESESLPALLAEDADNPEPFALVRTLPHHTVTAQIERHVLPQAARSSKSTGGGAADAEAIIRRNGSLKGNDEGRRQRLSALHSSPTPCCGSKFTSCPEQALAVPERGVICPCAAGRSLRR